MTCLVIGMLNRILFVSDLVQFCHERRFLVGLRYSQVAVSTRFRTLPNCAKSGGCEMRGNYDYCGVDSCQNELT